MKLRSVIAILATALLCISASAKEKQPTPQPVFNRAPLVEVPYAQLPLGEITPDGWLRAQMQTMLDGMTGNQAPSLDERERTMLAKVVMAAGSLLLIIFKVIALFILIGLVVGVSVLSFIALVTSPALFATDFITGLALACFFMVIILPILVLIYLTVMLLVSRRPSSKIMLAVFILWLLSLATMTISAIKSPVHFDRQIENVFESVFEKNSDILYEEFSEQEINEFRKQISNMEISTKREGDITVTLQGSTDGVKTMEGTLKISEEGVTISDQDGKVVEITPDGIKIDGKDFIDYTTETVQSAEGSTKAFIFSIGDVKVKFEKNLSEAIEKQKEANKQQEKLNKEAAKAMKNI